MEQILPRPFNHSDLVWGTQEYTEEATNYFASLGSESKSSTTVVNKHHTMHELQDRVLLFLCVVVK